MDSKEEELNSKVRLLPSWRFVIALCQCFGALALYMNRVNISFAIVCMTENNEVINITNNGDLMNSSAILTSTDTINSQSGNAEFNWSRRTRGFILSAFFIGYLLTQFPAGWILGMRKAGPKLLIFTGGVITIFVSFLSPLAARLGWGWLVAVQIIKGLACGVYYPSQQTIIAAWTPPDERSTVSALSASGASMGSIIGFLSAGVLCKEGFAGGWPSIFYVYACVGSVWLVTWFVFASDRPTENRFVRKEETDYILKLTSDDLQEDKAESVPWCSMLKSPPLYAIWTVDFTYHWLWYTALTLLPTFINDVFKIDLKTNGFLTSLPYLANFLCTIFASWIADGLIRNCLPTTIVRKIVVTCQCVVPAVLVIAVGFLDSNFSAAITCVAIAVGFLGLARSGHIVAGLDVAPRFSGAIMGVGNTIGTLAGVLAPIVTSSMVPNGTKGEWRNAFYLAAGFSLLGAIVFLTFGRSDIQPWAKKTEKSREEEIMLGPTK